MILYDRVFMDFAHQMHEINIYIYINSTKCTTFIDSFETSALNRPEHAVTFSTIKSHIMSCIRQIRMKANEFHLNLNGDIKFQRQIQMRMKKKY